MRAGFAAFGRLLAGTARGAASLAGWRSLVSLSAGLVSTGLTVAVPLLALNAVTAPKSFPDPGVDLASAGRQPSILILAADGSELGSRGSQLGEPVQLDALPPFVIDSFLATEDRHFFRHPGFNPVAMLRAAILNWRAGDIVQGGSTITQQLVKNLFLSGEQTLSRKIEELHLALWLEARLTKEEILELYLNRIYLGANTYGLSAASNAYFSKDPAELSLAEAALIAGLPKAPSRLAPNANFDGALARSHEVIDNLVEARKIDRTTARTAMMRPPALHPREGRRGSGYFLDHVATELAELLPGASGDLVVVTTLRPAVQAAAEAAVREVLASEDAFARGAEQAALIAYDEHGGIAAMIGGRSYEESQFNRATQARRQPGSAFKPVIFLAAIEAGFDQDTVLVDQPVQVDGWEPSNYRKRYLGPHRLREALARSSNTATVQITEAVGREVVIDAARRLGLESGLEPHPSLALGAFEVPLDELTASYQPFARDGLLPAPHAISEVRTRSGEVLYRRPEALPDRVISSGSAERMTDLLRSVTETGTGRSARVEGHEVAGKTGTTNGWRDAWFVGYSAYITAGVWVGNDDNREMNDVSGATYPARIWQRFMTDAHDAMGAAPRPLNDGFAAADRDLSELAATYAALRQDLIARAHGGSPLVRRPTPMRDRIRALLARQDGVEGRVGNTGEYRQPDERGRPQPGPANRVRGKVAPVDPGDDG